LDNNFSSYYAKPVIEVDLHNMEVWEAEMTLEEVVSNAAEETKEIIVIHGYRKGQAILNMVSKEFKHPGVFRKIIGFNNGITSLILK